MAKLDIQLIQKRFIQLFGVRNMFMDKQMTSAFGGYHLDIIAFDNYAHKHWGYSEEEHGSLKEFVRMKFGVEAEVFISFLIENA